MPLLPFPGGASIQPCHHPEHRQGCGNHPRCSWTVLCSRENESPQCAFSRPKQEYGAQSLPRYVSGYLRLPVVPELPEWPELLLTLVKDSRPTKYMNHILHTVWTKGKIPPQKRQKLNFWTEILSFLFLRHSAKQALPILGPATHKSVFTKPRIRSAITEICQHNDAMIPTFWNRLGG